MKAAVIKSLGSPLVVENVPDPVLGTGEVIVDVVAAGVLPYEKEVLSGERQYLFEMPMIPGTGGVGRVSAIGPDATRLKVGDWVICDSTVRSRDDARTPDIVLQGLSARGEGGLRLHRYYHDGSFAERMRVPTENAIPLGEIDPADAGRWCSMGVLMVPYGGFLAAGLKAGETVLVSGATGNFGGAAVMVAIAMGAARVVAPGRNETALNRLVRRFGEKVRPVKLTGDMSEDTVRMKSAAAGPIDCVMDLLPPLKDTRPVRAAAMTVREYGTVVLMGGVGMLGGDDLALPYPWIMRNNITIRGQWMYPREANVRMIAMIKAGLIDLKHFETQEFALDDANAAIEYAARHGRTVIRPSR